MTDNKQEPRVRLVGYTPDLQPDNLWHEAPDESDDFLPYGTDGTPGDGGNKKWQGLPK